MTIRSSPRKLGIIVVLATLALVVSGVGTAYAVAFEVTTRPERGSVAWQ